MQSTTTSSSTSSTTTSTTSTTSIMSRSSSSSSSSNNNSGSNKKSKKSPLHDNILSLISSSSSSSSSSLKTEYNNNQPYKHINILNFCNDNTIRLIHNEITTNLKADYKETDLFKVFQTGEIGNININNKKKNKDGINGNMLPNLLNLRDVIYSKEFRDFISDITGCNDLTERVDCSCNAYAQGCHLLCHDDVIGTRRVSYIIYLSDPDDEWKEEDGGALELYPLQSDTCIDRGSELGGIQGIPEALPTKNILPTFNSMVLFAVQPGRSYHSVQEVYADSKPRLSISGWYHGPTPPKGSDLASLNQIMTKGDDDRTFNPIIINDDDGGDNEDNNDNAILSKYINDIYLQADTITKINKQFCIDSSMQLKDFIKKDIVDKLISVIKQSDTTYELGKGRAPKNYQLGIGNGWQIVGPPHKRRYLLYDNDVNSSSNTNDDATAGLLLNEVRALFRTPEFSRYVKKLTTLTTIGYRDEIRRFRPGLDYTVAHFGVMTKIPRLDATLCFVDESDNNDDNDDDNKEDDNEEEEEYSCWDSGDVGGFECYIEADSEGLEASEVYRQDKKDDAEESLLSVTPGFNTLSLVLRDQEIMRFIKYLGSAAPGSRFDIAMEYEIVQPEPDNGDDDDDEDDDDDDNDDEEDNAS